MVGLSMNNELRRFLKGEVVTYYTSTEELRKTNSSLNKNTGVPVEIRTKHLLNLKRYRYNNSLDRYSYKYSFYL
jgi:hypothetical protein